MKRKIFIACILTLLFVFLNPETVLPQQSNAQLNDALSSIKKQIDDLEKEIARDRANKADPKRIKSKEDRLAMMKSMLIQMQGGGGNTNTKAIKNVPATTIVSYDSLITPIILKKPVVAPTAAQAKDKLMGFQGKRIDDSTLITVTGTLIRYSKKGNKIIIQPDKTKDPFIKINAELIKTEQRKNEMLTKLKETKNSFFFYPEILKACKEIDFLADSYSKLIANTIKLPPIPSDSKTKQDSENIETILNKNLEEYIAEEYRQLMNLLNNPPSTDNFPAPPKKEFDLCFQCDTAGLRKYNEQVVKWHAGFVNYESELIKKAFSIEHASMVMGNEGSTLNATWDLNIEKAKQIAFTRYKEKVNKLIARYKNDPRVHTVILQAALGIERQLQLLGAGEGAMSGTSLAPEFNAMFEKYIREEMQKKNYAVALHYSLILSYERQMQLLGVENNQKSLFNEVMDFNRFALNMDVDFEITLKESDGTVKGQAKGILNSNNKQDNSKNSYVSLGQLDCKWQLFLWDQDYLKPSGTMSLFVPMKAVSGKKWQKNNKGEVKTFTYSGPEDAFMGFPSSRINFCPDGNSDSVMLNMLNYDSDKIAGYAAQAKNNLSESYSIDFIAYANKIIQSPSKTKSNKEKLTELSKEVLSTSIATNPTGNADLDELQKNYSGKKRIMEHQKQLSQMSNLEPTLILFDAKNMSSVIIDNTTKISNNENKLEAISGNIHLKVVHSPVAN